MGVKACFRAKCKNIMCDRWSKDHGYICNDCFKELVNLGPNTDVYIFMSTPKFADQEADEDSYTKFNNMFPLSEDYGGM